MAKELKYTVISKRKGGATNMTEEQYQSFKKLPKATQQNFTVKPYLPNQQNSISLKDKK